MDYIKEAVLPSLKNHHDEHLLKQLKLRWDNHKVGGAQRSRWAGQPSPACAGECGAVAMCWSCLAGVTATVKSQSQSVVMH